MFTFTQLNNSNKSEHPLSLSALCQIHGHLQMKTPILKELEHVDSHEGKMRGVGAKFSKKVPIPQDNLIYMSSFVVVSAMKTVPWRDNRIHDLFLLRQLWECHMMQYVFRETD